MRDNHSGVRAGIDALCRVHVTPELVKRWDQAREFPADAMAALAAAGYSKMPVPEKYGGLGSSAVELAMVHRELARHALVVAQSFYSLWVLGAYAITALGNEEQRTRYLPRVASGDAYIAFALTEPGSGSDAAALRTKAVKVGAEWRVTGQKLFISGAAVADVIITAVRTSAGRSRHDGISLMLIDPRAPGVTIRKLEKVGLRALDLCEVFLDDVALPLDEVLGVEGEGWRQMQTGLTAERAYLAAICAGAIRDLLGLCVAHATVREAFGRPIGRNQMVAERIVNMRVDAEASDALAIGAAESIDAGMPDPVRAAVAKLFASEAYVSAARSAVQVFGGYGYTEEYPVARHYRDCKYLEIGGGTSEIQRLIIGREMGLM